MLTVLFALTTYADFSIDGWRARVDESWITAKPAEWRAVRRELEDQLYRITRVVPAPALAKVRQVVIWVHGTSPETKCMAYHPGAEWLRDHGMNPDMEKGTRRTSSAGPTSSHGWSFTNWPTPTTTASYRTGSRTQT